MKKSSEPALPQIRVIIADDHPVVRHGLRSILRSQKDIRVIAEADDGEEACQLCEQLSPDVLLLDLRMPKKDGLEVIRTLSQAGERKPQIIVMTTYEGEEDIRRALGAGAKGYLFKGANLLQVRDAVRKVATGKSMVAADVACKLAESMAHRELSEAELQVLGHLGQGKSNKQIGQHLYISENTVKIHVRSILKKLDATCRTEAVAIAVRRGLLRAP
jgi:two-component system NarL family response regulator